MVSIRRRDNDVRMLVVEGKGDATVAPFLSARVREFSHSAATHCGLVRPRLALSVALTTIRRVRAFLNVQDLPCAKIHLGTICTVS